MLVNSQLVFLSLVGQIFESMNNYGCCISFFQLNFSISLFFNPCQSSPSLATLVPLCFVIISLVFFYLCKVSFSGFLQFKSHFVDTQNNSKYRDWAPLSSIPVNKLGVAKAGEKRDTKPLNFSVNIVSLQVLVHVSRFSSRVTNFKLSRTKNICCGLMKVVAKSRARVCVELRILGLLLVFHQSRNLSRNKFCSCCAAVEGFCRLKRIDHYKHMCLCSKFAFIAAFIAGDFIIFFYYSVLHLVS